MLDLDAILAAALTEINKPDPAHAAFGYWYSSAGEECQRKQVIDAQAYDDGVFVRDPIKDIRHGLMAKVGTVVGDVLEAGCASLGYPVQTRIEENEPPISGRLDVEMPDAVLDWKVLGEKAWERLRQYGPPRKHVWQVNAYAVKQKKPRWILAYLRGVRIFEDLPLDPADPSCWNIVTREASPAMAQEVIDHWADVDSHRRLGTLPVIQSGFAANKFPCGARDGRVFCQHHSFCWTEATP